MTTVTTQPEEGRNQRVIRLAVSGLLVAEAAILVGVTVWIVVYVPMMMFAAVEPIAVGVMLTIASVHLFKRRRPTLVAILCGAAILLGAGPVFIKSQSDYVPFFLQAILIPIAGVIVALRMKPLAKTVNLLNPSEFIPAVESGLQKFTRITAGTLLGAEALLLLNLSLFITVIVPFLGGLAFIAGAGDASDSKITQAWWTMAAMVVVPWVVTAMEAVASVRLMMRTKPMRVVILCGATILVKLAGLVAAYYGMGKNFTSLLLLILVAPVAGLLVAAFQLKPRVASV